MSGMTNRERSLLSMPCVWRLLLLCFTFLIVSAGAAVGQIGPYVGVDAAQDHLWGPGWTPSGSVHIVIENPATPQSPDHEFNWGIGSDGTLQVPSVGFDIQPGHVVTVWDGALSKSVTVLPLSIESVNPDTDVVHGAAAGGSVVTVSTFVLGRGYVRHVSASPAGWWSADFSESAGPNPEDEPLDITPGAQFAAIIKDADNDQTQAAFHLPNPTFQVDPQGEWINGNGWPANTTVVITLDDPLRFPNSEYELQVTTDDQGNFGAPLQNPDIDLMAGHIVSVSDGITTKATMVTGVAVTEVDADLDVVRGVAMPDSNVNVGVWSETGGFNRWVAADHLGQWTADFSVAAGPNPNDQPFDIDKGTNGGAWQSDSDGDQTLVGWRVEDPRFTVAPYDRWMAGEDWGNGGEVNIQADDPGTTESPDFSASTTADMWGNFWIELPENGPQVGWTVTVSGDSVQKELVVEPIQVVTADPAKDVVGGTAGSGDLQVEVWSDSEYRRRSVLIVAGEWETDFSVGVGPAPEEQAFDIVLGTEGNASLFDADGDRSLDGWRVNRPTIGANVTNESVEGSQWSAATEVEIVVDDPGTAGTEDFTATATPDNEGNFYTESLNCDLQPGWRVTASQGEVSKTLILTNIAVDSIDVDTDEVAGHADGTWVGVDAWSDDGGRFRMVPTSPEGAWLADFSEATGSNQEDQPIDLTPGLEGRAWEPDADGDQSAVNWSVPNPRFKIDSRWGNVQCEGWESGTVLYVEADDPATLDAPDFETTMTCDTNGYAEQPLQSDTYGVRAGHVVTVTDGDVVKVTMVTDVRVTELDGDADVVSGYAAPYSQVAVNVWNEQGSTRFVECDATGFWSADFAEAAGGEPWEQACDLVKGTQGEAAQSDPDGDQTAYNWWLADPRFNVNARFDDVWGEDWDVGTELEVTADDPGTGISPDRVATTTAGDGGWFAVSFGELGVDIQPNWTISVTDHVTTKTHVVTPLRILGVNLIDDTVSGEAGEGPVDVTAWDPAGESGRVVTVDAGFWLADFSVPGTDMYQQPLDLTTASSGMVQELDEDRDATVADWSAAAAWFSVDPVADDIWGEQWPLTEAVTLRINRPSTPAAIDYSFEGTTDPWGAMSHAAAYDVMPGDVVQLECQGITKTHVVTTLEVTLVDPDSDTVAGTAAVGSLVEVRIPHEGGGAARTATANAQGQWSVDFSVWGPGEQNVGTMPYDITVGTVGFAFQGDGDGDNTHRNWVAQEAPSAPEAHSDEATVSEDGFIDVGEPGVLGNDTDANGDDLVAQLVSGPSHGTLDLAADGSYSYEPAAHFNGTDSFVYRAFDGGLYSNPATVTIIVEPYNDPPSFIPGQNVSVAADSGAYLAPWASGISPGPAEESLQDLHFETQVSSESLFVIQPAVSRTGMLSFRPSGVAGSADVTVTLVDDATEGGPAQRSSRRFTITMTPSAAKPTSLTIDPAPPVGKHKSSVRVTAVLRADGVPLIDESVQVYRRGVDEAAWTLAGQAGYDTESSKYYANLVLTQNTLVQFRFRPTDEYMETSSTVLTLRCMADVGTPSMSSTVYISRYYTAYSTLQPRHLAGTSPIKLECYRYESGRYRLRKTYLAMASDYSSNTRCAGRVRLPYRGRWRIRAVHADSNHYTSASGYKYVTAK